MDKKIYNAFDAVKADDDLKQNTLLFLQEQRTEKSKKSRNFLTPRLSAAVCALAVVVIAVLTLRYMDVTAYAYISVDVNPSVELTLNRWDKVIDVVFFNEEGKTVVDDVSVIGMYYSDAIDAVLSSDAMREYINDDSDVCFTVAAPNTGKEEELISVISKCRYGNNKESECYSYCIEDIGKAHSEGASFGKYSVYQQLEAYDSSITWEDCRQMTMSQIRGMLAEYENTDNSQSSDCVDTQDQNGFQAGSEKGWGSGDAGRHGNGRNQNNNNGNSNCPESGADR